MWFLVPVSERPRASQPKRATLSIWLWLALLAALAFVAAGPTTTSSDHRNAIVVELSAAMEGPGVADAKRQLEAADDDALIIVVAPESMGRVDRAAALARLNQPLPAGAVRPSRLRAGVALARRGGGTSVAVVHAPPISSDVAIASARFQPARLAAKAGHIVVELTRAGTGPVAGTIIAKGRAPLWQRSVKLSSDHLVVEVPYAGDGADLVEIELRVDGVDQLAGNNRAIVEVPSLARTQVFIEPDLRSTPVARALRALPTVQLVGSPGDHVVLISRRADTPTIGRAIIVMHSPTGTATAPLLSVPGSPLLGLTPRLLSEHAPVATSDLNVPAGHVWLRAGRSPAVFSRQDNGRDAVHIAVPLSGAVLTVALADIFATQRVRAALSCRSRVGGDRSPGHHETDRGCVLVQAAPVVTLSLAGGAQAGVQVAPARSFALIHILLLASLLFLLVESIVTRPTIYGWLSRAGIALVVFTAFGAAKTPEHRRVVFVVDVSASAGGLNGSLQLLATNAAELSSHDRAAVVVVAGGASMIVPLGSRDAVVRWARAGQTLQTLPAGVALNRTDLRSGFKVAAGILGNAPGEVVLISDGHDSVRAGAVVDSPELSGYSFRFVAVDRGDVARLAPMVVGLRGKLGSALSVPVTVEAVAPFRGELVIYLGAKPLARRVVDVAAGPTTISVPVNIATAGNHRIRAVLSAPGDRAIQNNERAAFVDIYGRINTLVLRGNATGLPDDARELSRYDVIVIDDVAYAELGDVRARRVVDFVRAGGTLVLSGTSRAFAGGGYTGTAIDRVSPLRSDPTSTNDGAAVVMLLDRSGSVARATNAPNLPGVGQLAAVSSRLDKNDLFGVIAFDVSAHPVRALLPATDKTVTSRLPMPHGGTNPAAALAMAKRWLQATRERRRVVVMVTDGGFPRFYKQTERAAAALATIGARLVVLTIGRNTSARKRALKRIAAKGKGFVVAGKTLTDAIPALRVQGQQSASTAGVAAPRHVLRVLLSKESYAAFDRRRVNEYVLTGLATDATALVDIGTNPLVAVRSEGGGHVFAVATKLHPDFTTLTTSIAAFTARAGAAGSRIQVLPTPTPHKFRVRVSRTKTRANAILRTQGPDGVQRTMRYRGGNNYESSLVLRRDATISVDGVRSVRVAVSDAEHMHLGVALPSTATRTWSSVIQSRVSRWLLWLLCIAIGLILILIAVQKSAKKTHGR